MPSTPRPRLSTAPSIHSTTPAHASNIALTPPAARNIESVVLGDLLFRTWYASFYPEEIIGKEASAAVLLNGTSNAGKEKAAGEDVFSVEDGPRKAAVDRLYVCKWCFRYPK